MKTVFIISFLLTAFGAIAGTLDARRPAEVAPVAFKSVACDFFTHDNAVKVLGGRATGADGGLLEKPDGRQRSCVFTASDRGENPPKLHFVLIKSASEAAAKRSFETVRNSNRNQAGFEDWTGVAGDALVHTDGKNFQLVMTRIGANSIGVKVNPADGVSFEALKTAMTSLVPKLSRLSEDKPK